MDLPRQSIAPEKQAWLEPTASIADRPGETPARREMLTQVSEDAGPSFSVLFQTSESHSLSPEGEQWTLVSPMHRMDAKSTKSTISGHKFGRARGQRADD